MAKNNQELTPLMRQYWDIKSLHPDKVLLFRMGDFFEMFYDDAVKAAPILGITLTQRNKKSEDQTPMCGVPHHSIGGPINKLLAAGLKVAICDQIEDAKFAKGLVKRAVTRILTPGMVYDSDTIEPTKSHYISAIDPKAVSFVDTTTGEAFYFQCAGLDSQIKIIQLLPVAELVIDRTHYSDPEISKIENLVSLMTDFKCDETKFENKIPVSAQRLYEYVLSLADEKIKSILKPFVKKEAEHRLHLSQQTLRHLEVFTNYRGEEKGSLFFAINRTKTSSGTRLLRQWLTFPLCNQVQIEKRLSLLTHFRDDLYKLKKIREILSGQGDIERRLSKIALPQCNGRDLTSLANSLKAALSNYESSQNILEYKIDAISLHNISSRIMNTIVEDAPLSTKQGHIIKKGISTVLDELIDLSTNAQAHIERLEQQERDKTGIGSLKIRYNNVFGYYIEITNIHKDKVPAYYQRKQTLANAERFCTDELIELEKKVLSAQIKRNELESEIFEKLRTDILSMSSEILMISAYSSEIDVLSSLAWLSLEENYARPQFSSDRILRLKQSRHSVVEQFQRGHFIANDIQLNASEGYLITGPNMAGKSTLMRQVALTVMLAQIGSYVPAQDAILPIYDAIYTRIGASDQLSEGLSTFMVEMTETAQMLQSATENSLLILDEVGRGTATYDGLCLAQSILEHIIQNVKAQVFFATHYHELTILDKTFTQLKNVHMKIHQQDQQIKFLHILSEGPAGESYGVHVAELAGLPVSITERAKKLLKRLESPIQQSGADDGRNPLKNKKINVINQMSLFDTTKNDQISLIDQKKEELLQELKKLSITQTSPLQALNKIAEWQEKLN